MQTQLRILHLEDNPADAELVGLTLAGAGFDCQIVRVDTRETFEAALAGDAFDLILADKMLPSYDGLSALTFARTQRPEVPFIFVSGILGEEAAIESLKEGATDYVLKERLGRLVPVTHRALREIAERQERRKAEQALLLSDQILQRVTSLILVADAQGQIIYVSPSIQAILGHSVQEALGDGWWRLTQVDAELGAYERANLTRVARGEISLSAEPYEQRLKDRDGRIHWMLWQTARGLAQTVIGVGHDITERKRAEAQIQQQIQRLAALRRIDAAINSSLDLRVTLNVLLNQVVEQLHVHTATILLMSQPDLVLEFAAGHGFRSRAVESTRLRLGDSFAGRVALERTLIAIPDLHSAVLPPTLAELVRAEGFVSYVGVPLIAKGNVKGILETWHRQPLDPEPEWLNFFEALAAQAAIAIDNAQLFDGVQRSNIDLSLAYDTTIEGWSRALDLRDKETEGHTQRVTEMTLQLAASMGLGQAEMIHIRRGALLHDIGKMGVPDAILLKPSALTADEWALMKRHPQLAYELLSPVAFLHPALDIPYCHHEQWNGTGYPRGLRAEQIPLAARIFAVVDVWDALRSDRPYRSAWPEEQVRTHIRSLSGSYFDPKVVAAFLQIV